MRRWVHKSLTALLVMLFISAPVAFIIASAVPTGGLVKVKSDTEMLGVKEAHGGGHLTWTITGEAARDLRAKIIRRYDTNGVANLQPAEVRGGTPRSYLMDVESLLENKMEYCGASIRGTAPLHSQQNEELELDVKGLIDVPPESTEDIRIDYYFDSTQLEGEEWITLLDTFVIDSLYDVFTRKMADFSSNYINDGFDIDADMFTVVDHTLKSTYWHTVTRTSHTGDASNIAWWCGDDFTGQYVPGSNDVLEVDLDLTGSQRPELSFWQQHSFQTGDVGYVEIDDGSGWSELLTVTGSTGTGWSLATIDLTPYHGQQVSLRFRFVSDDSGLDTGWFIDDFLVKEWGDAVLFDEDFEGDSTYLASNWAWDGNWATVVASPDPAPSGNRYLTDDPTGYYPGNLNTSIYTKDDIQIPGNVNSAILEFWHGYFLNDTNDIAHVEFSRDGGANWTSLAEYTDTGGPTTDDDTLEGRWLRVQVPLTLYAGIDMARLRFRLETNATGNDSGWSIDAIRITADYEEYVQDDFEATSGITWWAHHADSYEDLNLWVASPDGWICYDTSSNAYLDNMDNSIVTPTLDLSYAKTSNLTFEFSGRSGPGDYLYVEVERNGSGIWTALRSGITGAHATPETLYLPLDAYVGTTVRLRVRFESDSSGTDRGYTVSAFNVRSILYDGQCSIEHINYLVGLMSFKDPQISDGSYYLIRTPAGEILIFSTEYTYGEEMEDGIAYSSFDLMENPQVLFVAVFIFASFISYFPKRFYTDYKAALPAKYRLSAQKASSIHVFAKILILLLFLFYFIAGFGGMFVSGIYLFVMGIASIVVIAPLAKIIYSSKTKSDLKIYEDRVQAQREAAAKEAAVAAQQTAPPQVGVGVVPAPVRKSRPSPRETVQCQTCGEIFPRPDKKYKKVICPACGALATEVKEEKKPEPKKKEPERAKRVFTYTGKVNCPHCQFHFNIEEKTKHFLRCPGCSKIMQVIPTNFYYGVNYLISTKDPKLPLAIFSSMIQDGIGLCISTSFPDKLKKENDLSRANVIWLSDTSTGENTLDPKRIEFEVMRTISKFMKENKKDVTLLDGLEYLVLENKFEKVMKFVKKLTDISSMNESTIMIPINPTAFDNDEITVLRKEFDQVIDIEVASDEEIEVDGEVFEVGGAIIHKGAGGEAVPPGEVLIDDIFIVYENGALITHQTGTSTQDIDDEELAGMFTAIQDFILGSKGSDAWSLNKIEFGDKIIQIERGGKIFLGIVYEGDDPDKILDVMTSVIKSIESRFEDQLRDWGGDTAELRAVKEYLGPLFNIKKGSG